MNRKRLAAVIATAIIATNFWPDTSYSAMKHCWVAALREMYQDALRLCRPLAEQGDPVAQNALGGLYYSGDGVPRDVDHYVAEIYTYPKNDLMILGLVRVARGD